MFFHTFSKLNETKKRKSVHCCKVGDALTKFDISRQTCMLY